MQFAIVLLRNYCNPTITIETYTLTIWSQGLVCAHTKPIAVHILLFNKKKTEPLGQKGYTCKVLLKPFRIFGTYVAVPPPRIQASRIRMSPGCHDSNECCKLSIQSHKTSICGPIYNPTNRSTGTQSLYF